MGSFRHLRSRRRAAKPRFHLTAKVFGSVSLASFGFVSRIVSTARPIETTAADGEFWGIPGHSRRPVFVDSLVKEHAFIMSDARARLTHGILRIARFPTENREKVFPFFVSDRARLTHQTRNARVTNGGGATENTEGTEGSQRKLHSVLCALGVLCALCGEILMLVGAMVRGRRSKRAVRDLRFAPTPATASGSHPART